MSDLENSGNEHALPTLDNIFGRYIDTENPQLETAVASEKTLTLGGALKLFIETHHAANFVQASARAANEQNVSITKALHAFLLARDFEPTIVVGIGFKKALVNPAPQLQQEVDASGATKAAASIRHAVVRVKGIVIDLCHRRLGDAYEQANNFAFVHFAPFWKEIKGVAHLMAITPDVAHELARPAPGFSASDRFTLFASSAQGPSKLRMSLASAVSKKGDRVIVRAATNEWYTGTVTRVGSKSISVLFDDRATAVIQSEDWSEIKPMQIDFQSDAPLTDAEAAPLWKKSGTKSKVKVTLEPEKKSRLAPKLSRLKGFGQPKMHTALRGSNNPALISKWMRAEWAILNVAYFKGELVVPKFVVWSFTEEHQNKTSGLWKADERQICLGVSVFDEDELVALHALAHLMCHQAVSELDKLVGIGHGNEWALRMNSIAQEADIKQMVHDVPLMEKFETEPTATVVKTIVTPESKREAATKDMIKMQRVPEVDVPAMLWMPSGIWRKGLVLGRQNPNASKLILLTLPTTDKTVVADINDLYIMSDEDAKAIKQSPAWASAARRVGDALGLIPHEVRTVNNYYLSISGSWLDRSTRKAELATLPAVENPVRVLQVKFDLHQGPKVFETTKVEALKLLKVFALSLQPGFAELLFTRVPLGTSVAETQRYTAIFKILGFTKGSGSTWWLKP